MLRSSSVPFVILLIFAMFANWREVYAQSVKKPIRIITTRDGLPQSFVSGLVQDTIGFVWIGTRNGLARYDGRNFKTFHHSHKDLTTISSDVIISMSQDLRHRIWIEYESGQLDMLDPLRETVSRITSNPLFTSKPQKFVRRGWYGDFAGNLWLAQRQNGIFKYEWKRNRVLHFTRKSHGFHSDIIRGIMQDRRNQIWVLDQKAINRLDSATGQFVHIPIPADFHFYENPGSDAEIVGIHERSNGELMFGDRKDLFFFNPATATFRKIPLPVQPIIGIQHITTGPDGKDYLETAGNVYRYDDQSGLVKVGEIGISAVRETPAFMVDNAGLIWLGTNAAGIHQIDLSVPFFESKPNVHSFNEDVMQQELKVSLSQLGNWPLSTSGFSGSGYHFRSTFDVQGRLWIGFRNKVGYYDVKSHRIVLLPDVPKVSSPDNLSLGVRGISFAPDGTLWVIGHNGYVACFDKIKNKWVTFLEAAVLSKYMDLGLNALDIQADNENLFVTSGNGLFRINIHTRQIRIFSQKTDPDLLPTDLLIGMQKDPARPDLVWIGSYNGLIMLNKKSMKTEIFSMEKGLPDNTIYSILADNAGYLWLSTNRGLSRFHPVTHQVQNFFREDGLPGEEFNRFHHIKLPDGKLAFGGTEGWVIFNPTAMKIDPYRPKIAFTNLKINNINAELHNEKDLVPGPLNSLAELTLPYDHNSLTFEFAGLEFSRPKKLLYRYKLEGYDNDWVMADYSPIASYTKLPPGKYLFKINSSNSTGEWSPHVRELGLSIRPPFWLTWWAYCVYALAVAGMIWAYARYLANKERMRQEIVLKEKEARQLKELDVLKTRFFSNITHEFRTPLTLILTPAQRLKPTLTSNEQQKWVSAIERNAHQLLRLINQLLDLSKLEAGALKVNEAIGNPASFLEEIIVSFTPEADSRDIVLKFTPNKPIGNYWFDPDKLEQIISNLVANAIKFTPKGEVEVRLSAHQAEGIEIEVNDTGIGIPPEKLPHIFDRFYQADAPINAKMHSSGSGIGLSLVKEMVELQGGKLSVESSIHDAAYWKTRFSVWLPYRKSLSELEPETISPHTNNARILNVPAAEHQHPIYIEKKNVDEIPSVLLVEDNAELGDFIADSLPPEYHIIRAANGAEGMKLAIERIPDLVLSDVLMPVMDGFEFCRQLKEDERTNHIPIILLTAKSTFEDKMEGLTTGADDYLTKPFHVQELQLRVSNLLERQRQLRHKLNRQINSSEVVPSPPDAPAITLQDIFIQKIYTIVEDRLDDTAFGVEELAAQIGMSRASLHRKLKTLTGVPPGDMIRNYRLKRAAVFLKEGYNSSETAYKTGFDSPAYFSKCFREFYNVTPNEFVS